MTTSNFNSYGKYYDLLYKDKNYSAEVGYIADLLNKFLIPENANILEFGSGTGLHADILSSKGYSVTGVELSEEMILRSLENKCRAQIIMGDARNVRLKKKFDVVLSLFHVVSYQTNPVDINLFFKNAFIHLKDGGIFVFDVWYTPAVYSQGLEVRVKRFEDIDTEITRIAEPVVFYQESLVNVEYTFFSRMKGVDSAAFEKFTESHLMRHFTSCDINYFAKNNGFMVLHSEGFLTGAAPGANTWGVTFVLQKNIN